MVLFSLLLSTLLCFFSNSWLIIWVMLEINTLSFCSIKYKKMSTESKSTSEGAYKYLLVQSIASSILIVFCILKEKSESLSMVMMTIVTCSVMIKLAAAPLHYWFVTVTKKSSWLNNTLLFTWQKVMPLYLIVFQKKSIVTPFILLSTAVGSFLMMNKKSLKEIMALSSIFNLGWLISATVISLKILIYFSILYWATLLAFIKDLTKQKKTLMKETNSENSNKIVFFFKSINLAGIPPFMGFMAKWTVFYNMLKMKMTVIPSVMLVVSSINIFIYLRVSSKPLLQNSMQTQKNKKQMMTLSESTFMMSNVLLLQMFL